MPKEDIATMLEMIEAKIASSEIEVHHRAALVRLRSILEEDLFALERAPPHSGADQRTSGSSGDSGTPCPA